MSFNQSFVSFFVFLYSEEVVRGFNSQTRFGECGAYGDDAWLKPCGINA